MSISDFNVKQWVNNATNLLNAAGIKDVEQRITDWAKANMLGLDDRLLAQEAQLPIGLFADASCWGDSVQVGVGATGNWGWMQMLCDMMGLYLSNEAIGGTCASLNTDTTPQTNLGFPVLLQSEDRGILTKYPQYPLPSPGSFRLYALGYGFNDMSQNGGVAAIPRYIHAMRGMAARLLSGAAYENTDLTLTGNWGTQPDTTMNSGSSWSYSFGAGDYFELSLSPLYANPPMYLTAVGPINSGYGCVYEFTINGEPVTEINGVATDTIDTSSAAPGVANKSGYWSARIPVPTDIINPVLRGTLVSGIATIDAVLVQSGAPVVPVLVKNIVRPYSGSPFWAANVATRDANIATANAALQALAAEFEHPGMPNPFIYMDFDSVLNKMEENFWSGDGIHWSDLGYKRVANLAARELGNWFNAPRMVA